MKGQLVIFAAAALAAGLLAVSVASDQFADAGPRKKIHFTDTITSSQDPGQGHESHQMAMVLPPSEGAIYDGSMTFASSAPMQVAVLHEIGPNDSRGQPVWTVDGEKFYGISLVNTGSKAGSFEFTGAALAFHAPSPEEFAVTVSVDAWIRGQPAGIILQKLEFEKEEPSMPLSNTSVPATIPMHGGLHGGEGVFYIMTDSSDPEFAADVSERQGWRVELAPPIAGAPESSLQTIFIFTNGVRGDGLYGYQGEVFSSTPGEPGYGALNSVIKVAWKKGQNEAVLESAREVLDAEEAGRVTFDETGIVVNAPQIIWPGGQLEARDAGISGDAQYGGGQVTGIDRDGMTVTFVAHRGWGPDGRTIYHIVADATPPGPAGVMGVPHSPASADLIASAAAADLSQFQNGVRGPGPLGFQAGIAGAATGDENYTPMWRVYTVEWNDPASAKILETKRDIDSSKEGGLISISIARPMNSDHIINRPIIDPFQ